MAPKAIINGDPAFYELEKIFRQHGISVIELAAAFRTVREAIRREGIACLELCDTSGRCNCAHRIRDRLGIAP